MSTPAMSSAPSAAPSTPSAAPSTSSSSSTPSASSPSTPSSATSSQSSGSSGGDPGAKSVEGVGTPDIQAKTPAAQAKIAEEIRKHKLKVNGREVEFDEPEVLRRAQLAEGAEEKFREAADMRRQVTELLDVMKKDPIGVLAKLGLNPRQIAEQHLAGELQKEMLSPEQRELAELREFRKQQEQRQQQQDMTQKEQVRAAETAKLQQRAAQEYDNKISEVLAQSNLPKTAETVKRVAGLLLSAVQKGYDLDVPTAVDMVRQGYVTDIQSLFGGLKGEALVKMLGDTIAKEIRQFDLARIKQKLNPQQPTEAADAPVAAAKPRAPEKTNYQSPDDWIAAMRRKAGVES